MKEVWAKESRVRGLYAKELRGEELDGQEVYVSVCERIRTMCATRSSVTKVSVKELCR